MDTDTNITTTPDDGHSKVGPSKAEQWVNCLRSVSFIEENEHRLPPDEGSVYAAEGTEAHAAAADALVMLTTGIIGSVDEAVAAMDPKHHELRCYIEDCAHIAATPGRVHIEGQVPLFYKPSDRGTLDFGHATATRVTIRDLKWGEGEFVDHEDNKQLAIYAMSWICAIESGTDVPFARDTIVDMGICQPRYRGEEKLRTWVITLSELMEFCRPIEDAYLTLAMHNPEADPPLPFTVDPKGCRWCRAKPICPAYNQPAEDGLPVPLSDENALALLPELEVSALSDEQIVRIIRAAPFIEDIIKEAKEHAYKLACDGRPLPGTKLVQGRAGNRTWADEAEADKALTAAKLKAEDRYVRKLISASAAEKLVAPLAKTRPRVYKRVIDCITRPEGKPTLVLDDDPRPAIDNTASLESLPTIEDHE